MGLAGINVWAVILAAMASWLIGAAWYTALARPWLIALGKTRTELVGPTGKPSPVPFVVAFVAQLVMAGVLAGLLAQIGRATVVGGLLTGLIVWLGFVISTMIVNHGFSRQQVMLTVIDGGHWLVALLVQGAILGLFGS